MRKVLEVSRVTFLQLSRDRIFQLAIIFFFILLGLNILFSEITIAEKKRIYVNFGLSLVQVLSVLISTILMVMTYRRDIASKSLYTILVRPMSREAYFTGQFLGVAAVVTVLILLFATILQVVFLLGHGMDFYKLYWLAVAGILAEAFLVTSLALVGAVLFSYPVAIGLTLGVVALGHWMSTFRLYLNQSESSIYKAFGEVIYWSFPHLERVNFRYWPVMPEIADMNSALMGFIQLGAYCLVFILLAGFFIKGRDLV